MSSPYQKFLFALNAPESQRQYPKRLSFLFDFLKMDDKTMSIQEKTDKFYYIINEKGTKWLEDTMMEYITFQNQKARKGVISANTIKNYYKPIKLFCEMNGILVNWKLISKGIMKGNIVSSDRPPLMSEIKLLIEYPDIRIKMIVSMMISSGIRVGSWDHAKCKHVKPVYRDGIVVAAEFEVYNTKTRKWYLTFITPEAYSYFESYINFRKIHGEQITGESWILRDTWKIKSEKLTVGKNLGKLDNPRQFKSSGVRMMINGAWSVQGVRTQDKKTENNGKRYEFKSVHGFRKFFETECQKVMKPLNISYLMSHDTGITQHYFKPKKEDLLEDYLNAVDLLTLNEENRLKFENQKLKQEKDFLMQLKMEMDELKKMVVTR